MIPRDDFTPFGYLDNQFQYTAHLNIGLKIGKTVLVTPDDFRRQKCAIHSTLHTKNRFEYSCVVPKYGLTLSACYFLVDEDALGCIVTLSTTSTRPESRSNVRRLVTRTSEVGST